MIIILRKLFCALEEVVTENTMMNKVICVRHDVKKQENM